MIGACTSMTGSISGPGSCHEASACQTRPGPLRALTAFNSVSKLRCIYLLRACAVQYVRPLPTQARLRGSVPHIHELARSTNFLRGHVYTLPSNWPAPIGRARVHAAVRTLHRSLTAALPHNSRNARADPSQANIPLQPLAPHPKPPKANPQPRRISSILVPMAAMTPQLAEETASALIAAAITYRGHCQRTRQLSLFDHSSLVTDPYPTPNLLQMPDIGI